MERREKGLVLVRALSAPKQHQSGWLSMRQRKKANSFIELHQVGPRGQVRRPKGPLCG